MNKLTEETPAFPKGLIPLSPLYPLKTFLNFTRFVGGFPLACTNPEMTAFRFSRVSYFGFCNVALVSLGAILGQIILFLLNGVDFSTFFYGFRKSGLSVTDMVALNVSFSVNTLSILGFIYLFRHAAKPMTKFYQFVERTPHLQLDKDDLTRSYANCHRQRIGGYYFFAIIPTGLVCISYYTNASALLRGDQRISILVTIFFGIAFLKAFLPIMSLVSHILVLQTMSCIELMFEKYHDDILSLFLTNHSKVIMIEVGFYLKAVKDQFNELAEPVILMEFIVNLVTIVFGLFLGMIAFSAFSGDGFKVVLGGFGMAHLILASLAGFRIISVISQGQAIVNRSRKASSRLQDILMSNFTLFAPEEILQMKILIEWLDTKSALRPKDCFDLTFSTGLSISGILMTYVIVLLQFRIGE